MDEGSGTTADDESGNGNDGVISGATWITGVSGAALEFDGFNDIMSTSNSNILNSVNSLTISCWVKIQVTVQLKYIAKANGFSLFQSGNQTGLSITVPGTDSVKHPIMLGVWTQITGSYDGTIIRFYVDGVYKDKKEHSGTMLTGGTAFAVGSFSGIYWEGAIDEICVWNRVLSDAEVESHYYNTFCSPIPLSPVILALVTVAGVIIFNKKRKQKKFFNTNKNQI